MVRGARAQLAALQARIVKAEQQWFDLIKPALSDRHLLALALDRNLIPARFIEEVLKK